MTSLAQSRHARAAYDAEQATAALVFDAPGPSHRRLEGLERAARVRADVASRTARGPAGAARPALADAAPAPRHRPAVAAPARAFPESRPPHPVKRGVRKRWTPEIGQRTVEGSRPPEGGTSSTSGRIAEPRRLLGIKALEAPRLLLDGYGCPSLLFTVPTRNGALSSARATTGKVPMAKKTKRVVARKFADPAVTRRADPKGLQRTTSVQSPLNTPPEVVGLSVFALTSKRQAPSLEVGQLGVAISEPRRQDEPFVETAARVALRASALVELLRGEGSR